MNRSHMKLLAASLALALGLPAAAMAADDIAGNTRFDLSSVQETATYDRFVVVYRDGSTERGNAGAAVQAMSAAAGKAKLVDAVQFGGRALGLNYKRKLASGGDLVTTSRRLNAAETRQFVQQIAADPAVEFVQPDY